MLFFYLKAAEKERKKFIENCIRFDTPRLESEVFPADVRVQEDINWSGDPLNLTLDYYKPFNVDSSKECFLLIHGGAFVYGSKRLDKNFGMHLARYSGIPVANMDYTLMPEAGLSKIVGQIFSVMNFLTARYGIEKFHLTGDSAGGYLSLIAALAARSRHVAHDLWVFEKLKGKVDSAGLICGSFRQNPKTFAGIYFEGRGKSRKGDSDQRLPDYVYDLSKICERDRNLKVALITGEEDMLRQDNIYMKDFFNEPLFYDAVNDGEMKMFHVFPIAQPEWPASQKAIELITDNATRRL